MPRAKIAARVLRELASVPSKSAKGIASRISREIQSGFDRGVDPFGRRWARLSPATLAKGRRPPPLTDTGRGRRGVRVAPLRGAGIAMTSSVPYMEPHQFGAPNLPRRAFLPTNVLPRKWQRTIKEEIQKKTDETLAKLA